MEWLERPRYEDGPRAYDYWATVLDRWAAASRAGRARNLDGALPRFAAYYAQTYFSARRYARDYLRQLASERSSLAPAADAFGLAAAYLRTVWERTPAAVDESGRKLSEIAADIRQAKAAEEEGIVHIRRSLGPDAA
jgi:hypothetical protein